MIRRIISKGCPGVELGCITAAKESGIKTCGYTKYREYDGYNVKSANENCYNVLKKHMYLANGTLVVNIFDRPSLRVDESIYDLYCDDKHNILHISDFHKDNVVKLFDWINKNNVNNLHVYSYNDLELFEKESYDFFMKLYDVVYKE